MNPLKKAQLSVCHSARNLKANLPINEWPIHLLSEGRLEFGIKSVLLLGLIIQVEDG